MKAQSRAAMAGEYSGCEEEERPRQGVKQMNFPRKEGYHELNTFPISTEHFW
jgi:hypothetical protein